MSLVCMNENVLATIVYVFVASNIKISSFLHQFILMFTIKSGIFMSTTFSYYSLSLLLQMPIKQKLKNIWEKVSPVLDKSPIHIGG